MKFSKTVRKTVAAVVPCFKVRAQICTVVEELLEVVDHVIVVDDACPQKSGDEVVAFFDNCEQLMGTSDGSITGGDGRQSGLSVLHLARNRGVGGAVMAGWTVAKQRKHTVVVKVDGDGQMDPSGIPALVAPVLAGEADYTKGNRFFDPEAVRSMPLLRLIGNAGLSFLSKLSTGYWHLMDPTNGFTALHVGLLPWLHLEKIKQRYFFETDVLFRLGTLRAVVMDIPMRSRYGDEVSNLHIHKVLFEFAARQLTRVVKRLLYLYFLRGFSLGSVFLVVSLPLLAFSLGFGLAEWHHSISTGQPATAGTIMLAALPGLLGVQFLLAFFGLDMSSPPQRPISRQLKFLRKIE